MNGDVNLLLMSCVRAIQGAPKSPHHQARTDQFLVGRRAMFPRCTLFVLMPTQTWKDNQPTTMKRSRSGASDDATETNPKRMQASCSPSIAVSTAMLTNAVVVDTPYGSSRTTSRPSRTTQSRQQTSSVATRTQKHNILVMPTREPAHRSHIPAQTTSPSTHLSTDPIRSTADVVYR